MKRILLLMAALCLPFPALSATELTLETDAVALRGKPLKLKVSVGDVEVNRQVQIQVTSDGHPLGTFPLAAGQHEITVEAPDLSTGLRIVAIGADGTSVESHVRIIPGWTSLLPALTAILLALLFKDVLLSLFSGVFLGALFLAGWNPFVAFGRTIDHFIVNSLINPDHAKILMFSGLLGAMVGVMSKSGGTLGIVERLQPFATTTRRGQVATWMMGLLIFFDDYANTLIVGSTMRPITDRLKISREKLAYIVDSTAAPVASIVPISTWIGFEVGLLGDAFAKLDLAYDPYVTFLASIPFRFYPMLALVFGLTVALSCKDWGPMLKAERRAFHKGEVLAEDHVALADYEVSDMAPPDGIRHLAINALGPILAVLGVTIWGLYTTGAAGLVRADYPNLSSWLREVFSNANSFDTLLWASLTGAFVAMALSVGTRTLSISQAMTGFVAGLKAMLLAFVVLVLAWAIGDVCSELHTAAFLVDLAQDDLKPQFLPVLVFLISALVAFATGSSWATMSILVPLVIPLFHGLAIGVGLEPGEQAYTTLLLGTVSSVLAGAVWGDHCSPISDTTILSSMGSGCDHIAHVRTQLPYALSIGILGMVVGDLPTAFGLSPWISFALGTVIIVVGLLWLGKRRQDPEGA